VKEQPRGAMARATAVAEGVATAVRRRQREREPRVLLYRHPGDPVVLAPGAKGHDRILDLAAELVDLADEAAPEPRRRRAGRADPASEADGE
jgi:hypothetical protein